jgi:hypothetical protein
LPDSSGGGAGLSLRAELKKRTARSSVPSAWVKGRFIGSRWRPGRPL